MLQVNQTQPRKGGAILADALAAQGVTQVFCVPGESYLDMLDGLYSLRNRIQTITCRLEVAAVHMASAHAKLTGQAGVAIVTRGPGACHASIGVHLAQQDSTPLVLLVGQIPFAETDRESFQEVDYRQMFAPMAKWVTQIDDEHRIPELIAHAFDVATSGRPGPVVVALSEEMQRRIAEVADIGPAPVLPRVRRRRRYPRFSQMLRAAQRPLVIVGGAGWTAAGKAALRRFIEANDLPAAVGFRRQSLFPGTSANFVGDLGIGADAALLNAVKQSDLLIAIGTRLGEPVSQGYTLFDMAGATPLVHVYQDQAEIGRVYRPALGIALRPECLRAGGRGAAARHEPGVVRLDAGSAPGPPGAGGGTGVPPARSTWRRPCRRSRQRCRTIRSMSRTPAISPPGRRASCICAPARITWRRPTARWATACRPRSGRRSPARTGPVICFTGDGGFMMTGQELVTAVHHEACPIILVFNNAMYGTIRMYQERAYPGRTIATDLTNPDFAMFIKSFGGHAERVERTDELVPAVKRAMASRKVALIELVLDPEQITSRASIADLRRQSAAPAVHA